MGPDVVEDAQMGSITPRHRERNVEFGQSRLDEDNSGRDSSPMRRTVTKCAYCRKDRKKCERENDMSKCDRCKRFDYPCFGDIESTFPRREYNRNKCSFCRDARQKCLPLDRVWPQHCDRCLEKNLQCSEPGLKKRNQSEISTAGESEVLEANRLPLTYTLSHELLVDRSRPNHSSQQNAPDLAAVLVDEPPINTDSEGVDALSPLTIQVSNEVNRARMNWERANGAVRKRVRLNQIVQSWIGTPASGLCSKCLSLNLSSDSFIIQPKGRSVTKQAIHQPLHQAEDGSVLVTSGSLMNSINPGLQPRPVSVNLGTLALVEGRSKNCPFCKLVWKSFKDQEVFNESFRIDPSITAGVSAHASWELDGRELIYNGKSFSSRPRTRRIRVAWSNPSLQHAYIVLVAGNNLPRGSHFLGRSMEKPVKKMELVRSWIDQCDEYHDFRCEVAPVNITEYASMVVNQHFRLLDVDSMKVSPMTQPVEYVALSYVGGVPNTSFLRSKSLENLQHGIMQSLPRTIQDAINVTKELGIRYLWVYAFCVVFDFREDLLWNHSKMDQIFGNAYLTICAADDPGLNAGLQALDSHLVTPQHMETCGPNLQLMVSYPAETYIKRSTWSRRAWTLQERLLSRRCLVFAEGRVWFQCHGASMSEDIITSKDPGWSIDMLRNPVQVLGDLKSRDDAIRAYLRCVELYTPREITHVQDFLLGFEGLCKLLGKRLDTGFISGLPSSLLDLSILWEPENGHSRRRDCSPAHFPSWSWSGWVGSMIYRSSTISGIMENVESWLVEHTWISWYTRDRHNNLRLLSQESCKAESATKIEGSATVKAKIEPSSSALTPIFPNRSIKWPGQNRSTFYKKIPDSYGLAAMDLDHTIHEDPTFQTITFLQFWTWSAFFYVRPTTAKEYDDSKASHFNILDYKEDICGTIILPDEWKLQPSDTYQRIYEFIAISEAKDFTPDEYDEWTYYIPKEREDSKWDLWYVLLVEKVDDVVVNRVGLGKVFKEAFENSCEPGMEWREFIMS